MPHPALRRSRRRLPALAGLNLLEGFRAALKERLGGSAPHLTELAQVPTAVIQAFMKIHEYQGKEILRAQFFVPVPRGYLPPSACDEATEAAQKLGGPVWVVKAQIHAGGRGKGGGVKLAKTLADRRRRWPSQDPRHAARHAPDRPRGPEGAPPVHRGRRDIKKEYYVSAGGRPRDAEGRRLIASSEGGMDIEEAHRTPEKIITEPIDPAPAWATHRRRREIAGGGRHPAEGSHAQAGRLFKNLYRCFMETDMPRWPRSTR